MIPARRERSTDPKVLLSIAYFPPVSYFALLAKDFTVGTGETSPSVVHLDACEHYQKQSWRNRCRIYASDGPQYLNFPVVHGEAVHRTPITEVRVDYSVPWVVRTERSISSAYETSAFFDFYKDELFSILESQPPTLFELDLRIIEFFLRKTGIQAELRLTEDYVPVKSKTVPTMTPYGADYREIVHPKRPDTVLRGLGLEKPYFQVFARKHGFIPNLSILDLLFNEGPGSLLYLKKL